MIFGTFGARIWPHMLLKTPYEWLFYLWDTLLCMFQSEIWFYVKVIWLLCPKMFKMAHFRWFFCDLWDLLSQFTTQYLTLWSPKCFVVVSIDLSERNWCEMICHILCLFLGSQNPRCWSIYRFAWRIFAVFRVYFAIFIYGNYRDVYFQNPLRQVVWKLVYPMWKFS